MEHTENTVNLGYLWEEFPFEDDLKRIRDILLQHANRQYSLTNGRYRAAYNIKVYSIDIPDWVRDVTDDADIDNRVESYTESVLTGFVEDLEHEGWVNGVDIEGRSGGWLMVEPMYNDLLRYIIDGVMDLELYIENVNEIHRIVDEIVELSNKVREEKADYVATLQSDSWWEEILGVQRPGVQASLKLSSWEEVSDEFIEEGQGFFGEEKTKGGVIIRLNKKGQFHNTRGPAIIYTDGTVLYYQNGYPHRTDGPAVIYANGTVAYWVNGERHRTDGPAIVNVDGTVEYWVNDKQLSEEEFNQAYGRNRVGSLQITSEVLTPEEMREFEEYGKPIVGKKVRVILERNLLVEAIDDRVNAFYDDGGVEFNDSELMYIADYILQNDGMIVSELGKKGNHYYHVDYGDIFQTNDPDDWFGITLDPNEFRVIEPRHSSLLDELDWEIERTVDSMSSGVSKLSHDDLLHKISCRSFVQDAIDRPDVYVYVYDEFPDKVRTFVSKRFSKQLTEYPSLRLFLETVRLEFVDRPDTIRTSAGARYIPERNCISYFKGRDIKWQGVVHEIAHAVQAHLAGRDSDIPPLPDISNESYYTDLNVYSSDAGEVFAKAVEDEFVRFSSWEEPLNYTDEELEYLQGFYREEKDSNGTIRRYNRKGQLHNTRGPAVILDDGTLYYYVNRKLHRTDGPAVIYPSGTVSYWVDDGELIEEEFNQKYGRNRQAHLKFSSLDTEAFYVDNVFEYLGSLGLDDQYLKSNTSAMDRAEGIGGVVSLLPDKSDYTGFLLFRPTRTDEQDNTVIGRERIRVKPRYRGMGVSKVLVDHMVDRVKSQYGDKFILAFNIVSDRGERVFNYIQSLVGPEKMVKPTYHGYGKYDVDEETTKKFVDAITSWIFKMKDRYGVQKVSEAVRNALAKYVPAKYLDSAEVYSVTSEDFISQISELRGILDSSRVKKVILPTSGMAKGFYADNAIFTVAPDDVSHLFHELVHVIQQDVMGHDLYEHWRGRLNASPDEGSRYQDHPYEVLSDTLVDRYKSGEEFCAECEVRNIVKERFKKDTGSCSVHSETQGERNAK